MTTPAEAEHSRIDEFLDDLAAHDLQPLWTQSEVLMPSEPKPATVPWLWKWSTLQDLGRRAGDLITIERGGDRRVLSLSNPGLGGAPFASSTLWGAIQYLGANESAPGHRHTPGAIRFVLEGAGVWTTVDGDACDMSAGDLILTPSWAWHDHNNSTDEPMIWFDGLDLPTVIGLDAVFFQPYEPDELQVVRGHNLSERVFGGKGTLPAGSEGTSPNSPLLVYRWTDTDAALEALLDNDSDRSATLEYVNPTSGRSVMPTLACEMHRILPGGPTPTYRKVGSSVFVVFDGAGHTVIEGTRFDWERGDMFVVPSWARVTHEVSETSNLFAISDAPMLKALNLYRDEFATEPHDITGTFEPRH